MDPAPTEADMLALREHARQYTPVFLRKGPASREDEARALDEADPKVKGGLYHGRSDPLDGCA